MTNRSNVSMLNGSDVLQKLLGLSFALLLFASGAAIAPALAQAAPTPQAAASPAVAPDERKAKEVVAAAESLVTEFEVNGLKVLVKRRAGSQTVAAGLFVRGGASNVTAQTAGVEALMWDVATEASAGFPRDLLRKETSRMGTTISYGVNYDYSALSMISTRPNFDRSWEIFADVALRPAFAADDFRRVQSRMVISRQGETDTPDAYLQVLQSRAAYAGHPYTNDPSGTAESIARFTIEDLRRHHQRVMQTSRLLLVVVGDLDAAALRERIGASFGKLPRGEYKPAPAPQLAFATPTVEFTAPRSPIPTNYIQGVFAAPALTDADIHAMRVASQVLNDRVLLEVRFRRNLSYAPSAFLRDQGASLGGVYVTADDQKANEAVAVMLSEINKLQREPVAADDLAAQINGYLTRYYIDQETNAAQAGELARYELIGGGWRNSLRLFESLRAVTPADIQRVARKYMRNLRFVVIGDPARVDKNLFTTQSSG
ncbi:MAG TPA: pitrilysin family protein [Pyrinomonadaceae bacterium]|nr:pitrilysin family protein [Pyrinomonadaceae bacterium]